METHVVIRCVVLVGVIALLDAMQYVLSKACGILLRTRVRWIEYAE